MTFNELLSLKNSDPDWFAAAWGDEALKRAAWITWENFSARTSRAPTRTVDVDLSNLRNTTVNKWDTIVRDPSFIDISPTNKTKVATQNVATIWANTESTTASTPASSPASSTSNSTPIDVERESARSNILSQIEANNRVNSRNTTTQANSITTPTVLPAAWSSWSSSADDQAAFVLEANRRDAARDAARTTVWGIATRNTSVNRSIWSSADRSADDQAAFVLEANRRDAAARRANPSWVATRGTSSNRSLSSWSRSPRQNSTPSIPAQSFWTSEAVQSVSTANSTPAPAPIQNFTPAPWRTSQQNSSPSTPQFTTEQRNRGLAIVGTNSDGTFIGNDWRNYRVSPATWNYIFA